MATEFTRRDFLKISATGTALAVGSFGQKQVNKLIPYVNLPENIKPGIWIQYATTCRECPAGCGLVMRQRNSRVCKAEAAKGHPVSYWGLCARGQSSVQGLYDPDRIKGPMIEDGGAGWDKALAYVGERIKTSKGKVLVVSGLETGSFAEVIDAFAKETGGKAIFYEAFNYEGLRKANEAVHGHPIIPRYNMENCDAVLSFGADFLEAWISNVEYAAQFSTMRTIRQDKATLGRMYYFGPRLSMTAANAHKFIKVRPQDMTSSVMMIIKYLDSNGLAQNDVSAVLKRSGLYDKDLKINGFEEQTLKEIAERLRGGKRAVAIAGEMQGRAGEELAKAVALLNYAIGATGKTVNFSQPHALSKTVYHREMMDELDGLGKQDTVIMHGTNPVYSLPESKEKIRQAGLVVYVGSLKDESAAIADVILPTDTPLERWGDYEPWRGIHCIMQPGMGRFYDTMSPADVLMAIAKHAGKELKRGNLLCKDYKEWMTDYWRQIHARVGGGNFDEFWNETLARGFVVEKPSGKKSQIKNDFKIDISAGGEHELANDEFEFWPWQMVLQFDGRTSNRNWMQEIPEPVNSIVWGNCAEMHPSSALKLGLRHGDKIQISDGKGRSIEVPVGLTEFVDENIVALSFGQGHEVGSVAAGYGANAFKLASFEAGRSTVKVKKIAEGHVFYESPIPSRFGHEEFKKWNSVYLYPTQKQFGRDFVKWTELSEVLKMKPGEGEELRMPLPEGYDRNKDLYAPHYYKNHRWAMVVDINKCIGCKACETACYAENNITVFGKEPLAQGREMAWLSVPLYRKDDDENKFAFLPMLCQHCDAAPCEPVCPVFASVHNDEGLNAQVYNRCVGTRYCNNNCPYKVRRFMWLNPVWPEPLTAQLNPEVTVRCRGVMEKCTFCLQRIRAAELAAKREHRKVQDGEIVPACVQTCPMGVYTFGDLMDPDSEVTKVIRLDPRRYQVLEELNTKPGIIYLKKVVDDA